MEFTCERGAIFETLGAVQAVIPGRSVHPVLANVLLNAYSGKVTILGTDLDIAISGEFSADIISEGAFALPAKKLFDLLKEFGPGDIKFRKEKTRVEISQGAGRFFIGGVEKDDYPAEDILRGETNEVKLPVEDFRRVINGSAYAISADAARIALSGLLIEITGKSLTSVATDGHRLTMLRKEINLGREFEKALNVPAKTVSHLTKMAGEAEGDIVIEYADNTARFKIGEFTITSKLINERFPDYNQVIPKDNKNVMICDRELLISALKRASVLSNPITHLVRFGLKDNRLEISCSNYDVGGEAFEEIPIDYMSDPFEIGFNSNYLLEVLRHFETDEIKVLMKGALASSLFVPLPQNEGEEYLSILMPLRLPEAEA